MKNFFPYIVLTSALSLAGIAAYYSIFGLSRLFSAQANAVIIMATALELSKLITATFLHRFWKRLNVLLKIYLTTAVVTLMMITSLGIYGFLTSAYQTTSDELKILDTQVSMIEMKKSRYQLQLDDYSNEKSQLANSITELTKGLSNNKIQYRDKVSGKIITTTSSRTRKVLQGQLNDFKIQRNKVTLKIESLTDSVTKLDVQILNLATNNSVVAEVGPLKYISKITNMDMDNIVNYFVLAFIFVFDPLAVLLLISANKAFELVSNKTTINKDQKLEEGWLDELQSDSKKYDNFTSDGFRPPHPSDAEEWDEDQIEKRVDIIGQNGNDGLHYTSGSIEKENIYKEENEESIQSEKDPLERTSNAYWS